MPVYRFSENPGTREILCHILPGAQPSDLIASRLRQDWDACEFASCHLQTENIDAGLNAAIEALVKPVAAAPEADDTPPPLATFVIATRKDATCTVTVSDDSMSAEAAVTPAAGGAALGWEIVCAAVEAAGVVHGIDESAIASLIREAAAATPGLMLHGTLARGSKPGKPLPSYFENLVTPFQDRVLRPRERADGSVDFHDLGDIESVHEGDLLVRRHPPRAGRLGHDVLGNEIASELLPETPFAIGEGTATDPEKVNELRATRGGVPHRLANGMSVNDVLQVNEVDLHTGNIKFDGSLIVKNDIHSDMRVSVTKDVIVGGFIEAAEVEAGGDITAKQGIIGPAVQGSQHACQIKGSNITTKYVQNAALEAAEDIKVELNLMHCHVTACRNLTVGGERSKTSRICGGAIHASISVAAGVLGSESETPTRIVMDDAILKLRREADSHYSERLEIEETCEGLEHSLKELGHKPKTAALDEMMSRIENTIRSYRDEIARFDREEQEKRDTLAAMTAACRVIARARIYPGLDLQCMDARHRFSVAKGPCEFGLRDAHWTALDH